MSHLASDSQKQPWEEEIETGRTGELSYVATISSTSKSDTSEHGHIGKVFADVIKFRGPSTLGWVLMQ